MKLNSGCCCEGMEPSCAHKLLWDRVLYSKQDSLMSLKINLGAHDSHFKKVIRPGAEDSSLCKGLARLHLRIHTKGQALVALHYNPSAAETEGSLGLAGQPV